MTLAEFDAWRARNDIPSESTMMLGIGYDVAEIRHQWIVVSGGVSTPCDTRIESHIVAEQFRRDGYGAVVKSVVLILDDNGSDEELEYA